MAGCSAHSSLPCEVRSRGDGGPADYAESLSACTAGGGGLLSSLLTNSATLLEATGGQPTAADALALSANLQELRSSEGVAPRNPDLPAPSPPPVPPPSSSRRYYLQPLAAASGGRTLSFGGAAASAPSVSTASRALMFRNQPYCSGEVPATFTDALPYDVPVGPAQATASAERDGVDRRLQTQRPLHRAHPYGSSLLGRLAKKIATSFLSLSSLVPRASAASSQAQKSADTTSAAAARGVSPEALDETRQHQVSRYPLQEPIYSSTVRCGGMNAYSVHKRAGGGLAHLDAASTNAAAPAVLGGGNPTTSAAGDKDTQEAREDTAVDFNGGFVWLLGQQDAIPYDQTRPPAAVSCGTSAVPTDSERLLSEHVSSSSFDYSQQEYAQRQQQLRQQQLRQQQLRQEQLRQEQLRQEQLRQEQLRQQQLRQQQLRQQQLRQQQLRQQQLRQQQLLQMQQHQQLRRLQVQAGGLEGIPGETRVDADAGEFRKQGRFAGFAAAKYGDDGLPYVSLAVDAARRGSAAGGESAGERIRTAAVGSASQPYSYYEGPKQRVLAKSCFDSVAADGVALDGDADVCGDASFMRHSVLLQQQQRQQMGLSTRRDFGAATTAAGNHPADDMLFYDDYGVPLAAGTPGISGNGGRLLSNNGHPTMLAQQAERVEQQEPLLQPSDRLLNAGSSFLPDGRRQQQGVPTYRRVPSSGLQEETDSGVSLSRTSSNSVLFTVPDDGFSKARRRVHRGCRGASFSLFSQAVPPAWLSSASADLLDADAGAAAAAGDGTGAAGREQSIRAARTGPRSTAGTGAATKSAARGGTAGTRLYPRQEQLTVEQLQKLYLRCQPLRWRVRLRDLLTQEAVEAAAAAGKQGQVFAEREPDVSVGGTVGAVPPRDGKLGGTVPVRNAVGEEERRLRSVESSSQTQPTWEEQTQAEVASGRRDSTADKAAESAQQGKTAATKRAATSEEQEQKAAVTTGSSDGVLDKLKFPGGAVQQASSAGAARTGEEKQLPQVPESLSEVTEKASSAVAGFGRHEQDSKGDNSGGTTGAQGTLPESLSDAASNDVDAADGSKRSKPSTEAAATDGGAGVVRSLFGSGSSFAGGAGATSSSLFGSSSSLFGISRRAPVASGPEGETRDGERVAEGASGSTKASAGEKPTLSLFGQSCVPAKDGGSSSVSTPLFGSSSLFHVVDPAAAAHQQQPPDNRDSTSGKVGATPSSLFGDTAPPSRLFGGTRSSSVPQQQPQQPVGAEQATGTSQPPANKQTEEAPPAGSEAVSASGTQGHESKDTTAPGKATAVTAAGGTEGAAAQKSADDTSALPWWQQNLNKPCSVMPEEDFAPEADGEEEPGEEKTKESEELPPLKVPNIFGSSNSSGGLFGSAGAGNSSVSLFKTAATASFSPTVTTSVAPAAASTGAASGAPALFGAAGTGAGLWNHSSSGSSLFGGLKPSAGGSATLVPPGSLFGGQDSSKQSSSQLPGAESDVPGGTSGGSSGTQGEKQPTSLFGDLTTSSSAFVTQKSSASLFGGSIFGNPVATSQSTNSSQQTAGASGTPGAGTGLFVFGASAGSSAPAQPAATTAPSGPSQPVSDGTGAVPSIFGASLQQSQQSTCGTGKRGRDGADGGGAPPAAKSLFGAVPAPTPPAAGGGLGLFGQRLPAGGSNLFGGGTIGSGGLFNTGGTAAGPGGQTEKNTPGKTGVGGGGIFGDRDNSGGTSASIFGAPRSVTPVFGSNSNCASKDSISNSTSTAAGGGSAPPGASASTGTSSGLFGSSSNNNPFGFGGGTGPAGVSLFGGSTSAPTDNTRGATAEGSFTGVQPLWSAGKGSTTITQGLFSVSRNSSSGVSDATSRSGLTAVAGGASNGMLESSRSLFGASAGGTASTPPGTLGARSATAAQGGLSSVPGSLFGNPASTSAFTFGAAPASITSQQQQQASSTSVAPAAAAPTPGGAEAGANPFFGALPSGVRRPRLTIKRSKQ